MDPIPVPIHRDMESQISVIGLYGSSVLDPFTLTMTWPLSIIDNVFTVTQSTPVWYGTGPGLTEYVHKYGCVVWSENRKLRSDRTDTGYCMNV